ncbi:MAG TPA: protein kinase [Anaerolineales bacterium]|nr:protein kinase [Anaerolineales bacterium]
MSNWAGRLLGKVHVKSLLARGGMAEVYLGTHITLHRDVVVKILRSHDEEDPSLLERFEREARVVAKLRHPHIVQVFDFDTIDDQPYIVMEHIPGPSLSKYLKPLHEKMRRLPLPFVSRILTGVGSALQYAHDSGVIHRDVKPGNILLISRTGPIVPGEPLPADFEPVLTDFGLVRILSSSQQTTTGRIAGTPAYMSPEQALGEHTDGRTDVYSLGVVLYQLLAGRVPFEGDSTVSVLLKQVNETPASISGLSALLQKVLDRALAKNPADRFQTPREFVSAFNAILEESSEANTLAERATPIAVLPVSPTPAPARPRRRWIPATLAGFVITALGVFALRSGFAPAASNTPTPSPTIETLVAFVSSPLGPTGLLRFEDGTAIMDQATLTALAMPAPPAGSQYEAWLVGLNGEARRSLGILKLDENGRGKLTYEDRQDQNLLVSYNQVEITLKPSSDSSSSGFEQVAYSYTLPESGLEYIRRLLVSSSMAPGQVPLIQGMKTTSQLVSQSAGDMLSAYENEDEARTRESAEAILNLLVGSQSPQYKDWSGDGQVSDPGDGYGLLRNGNNLGYIQAVYSHADYAVNSPGASQNMIVNGEHVKACAQNLAQWAPQLRDRILMIFSAASPAEPGQPVGDSVALANQLLKGIDLDGNETVEPTSGECGVATTYEYAYYMADMPLLPVNLLETPTAAGTASPTATPSVFIGQPTNTSTRPPNPIPNTSLNTPVSPTDNQPNNPTNPPNPQPTKKPKQPTNTPRPHNTPKPVKTK